MSISPIAQQPAGMSPYDSNGLYPAIDAWDSDFLTAQAQVAAETGEIVPLPVGKAIMEIESQGDRNVGCSPDGYCGLMQTGPGSMGAPYDESRLSSDPEYSIYTGLKELALREQNSGYLPWDNVAVGYFSGHYYPVAGNGDAFGTTDQEYMSRFEKYVADFHGTLAPNSRQGNNAQFNQAGIPVAQIRAAGTQLARRMPIYIIGAAAVFGGIILVVHHNG